MSKLVSAVLLVFFGVLTTFVADREPYVIDVLEELGVDYSEKRPRDLPGVSAEAGKELFWTGKTRDASGRKTKEISPHFKCYACHNVEREDPNLKLSDPQARLTYTNEKGIPFLQGTTMYGLVNRDTYYNGDYLRKYGSLVEEARHDVRKSIQLCATECAQGRRLADWEVESLLAYFWELQYGMEDLGFSDADMDVILEKRLPKDSLISMIQSQYLSGSPATFVPPPADRKAGTGLEGDEMNGELIYRNSCLHCHYQGKFSYLFLDTGKLSRRHLARKVSTYSPHSVYQVTRWGVGSHFGKNSYMPQYTEEKLSDQQLADLIAYLRK